MDGHTDFHGLTILIAIGVAFCGVFALLIFFVWLDRRDKHGSKGATSRGKVGPARKKRRK